MTHRNRAVTALRLLLVNAVVLAVLLEIAAGAAFSIRNGGFFYTAHRPRTATLEAQLDTPLLQPNPDNLALVFRLHPYFGFVYRPGWVQTGYSTNNLGFLTPYPLPLAKTDGQVVVGLFGGSVAALLSQHELEHHVLADALRSLPRFRGKQVVVVSLAAGSYKQPQQLLVLSYLLARGQSFDLVINVDGFNEAAFSYMNNEAGVETSMPSASLISPLIDLADKDLSPKRLTLTLAALQTKRDLRQALTRMDECRSATCYTLTWMWKGHLLRRYHRQVEELSHPDESAQPADSLVFLHRSGRPLADGDAREEIARDWANCSLMMRDLLAAKGVPYFHFLQPNQYYVTHRTFGDAERRIAFDPQSTVRAGVELVYPSLRARVDGLRAAGVEAFDATSIFDDVAAPVYVDSCCHYNPLGTRVLADHLARTIVSSLGHAAPQPGGSQ